MDLILGSPFGPFQSIGFGGFAGMFISKSLLGIAHTISILSFNQISIQTNNYVDTVHNRKIDSFTQEKLRIACGIPGRRTTGNCLVL